MTTPDTPAPQAAPASRAESALAERGLAVPAPVSPVGSYVPALRTGNLVFTSGQLPMRDGQLLATGKVGDGPGLIDPARANELATVCALNALAAIKAVVGDLDRVTQVVKVVGFVASDPAFTGQPGVVNGASDTFTAAFGQAGVHARSAVGVASLPLDAPVEVEVVVAVAD